MGRICPPGLSRVKVSGNLGVTAVLPVNPVEYLKTRKILLKFPDL